MVIIISVPFTFNVHWLKVAAIRTSMRGFTKKLRTRCRDGNDAPDDIYSPSRRCRTAFGHPLLIIFSASTSIRLPRHGADCGERREQTEQTESFKRFLIPRTRRVRGYLMVELCCASNLLMFAVLLSANVLRRESPKYIHSRKTPSSGVRRGFTNGYHFPLAF